MRITLARCFRNALLVFFLLLLVIKSQAGAGLELELSTPKTDYLLDERIFLVVTVRNTGTSDARFIPVLDPDQLLEISVIGPKSRRDPYLDPAKREVPKNLEGLAITLGPGEKYSASLELTHDMNGKRPGVLLSEPGGYQFKARYTLGKGQACGPMQLVSNLVSVQVGAPGRRDALAHESLFKWAYLPDWGIWNTKQKSVTCYEHITQSCKGSVYATYSGYQLALVYYKQWSEDWRGTSKGMQLLKQSSELLDSVISDVPDTPLAVRALESKARNCLARELIDEYTETLVQAMEAPAATNEDILGELTRLKTLEDGGWKFSPGYDPTNAREIRIPLGRVAKVLGFESKKDPEKDLFRVTGRNVDCAIVPGKKVTIGGKEFPKIKTWPAKKDEVYVSPALFGALLNRYYGAKRYNYLM